ncbi:zinc transporter 1 [Cyprinus carpio]|uniref:Solute carrier family 30 member 1b n=1 Tax=Cyprinus carpio TaxID=7962 RepID=A0A8C1QCW9_CYPCA|nr:zinc transporter 1 [Cyprinus carpio]
MCLGQNRVRLLCMLSLTLVFFFVEVVVSRITASLAMLSDSFHMLSDVIALIVALIAVSFAETARATSKNTYGWIRAEVMGALVNAVFLTALCFTIVLEAVERYTLPHEIENPRVVIWVGVAGLLVNVLGLFLFHGHAGFGGHGHSHGGHSHLHKTNRREFEKPKAHEEEYNLMINSNSSQGYQTSELNSDSLNIKITAKGSLEDLDHSSESSSQMNMRGVFLHVFGDALGSVIVVVNALIFTFVWTPCHSDEICFNPCRSSHLTEHQHVNTTVLSQSKTPDRMPRTVSVAGPCWVLYLDPTLCLIMVCILLYTAFPLLKESALILLQTVPKQIDMHKLNGRLRRLDGVMAVHDLHIWQLAGSRIIATVHIKCTDPASYMDIAKRIKDIFHDEGIHATTVQPEFSLISEGSGDSQCELSCRNQCKPKLCCNPTKRAKPVSELTKSKEKPCRHTVGWADQKEVDDTVHMEMESMV